MERLSFGLEENHLDDLLMTIDIGAWDWELSTGKVIYSSAWANILGYEAEELQQTVDTWEKLVLPEDLSYANEQIAGHLKGKKPLYEAEFRMVCKDGSIIWAQDKGRVVEYDEKGNPKRFVGVLQNVMRLKTAELLLRENQETLDLAVNVSELGTWDWDIPGNVIKYNDEYLRMLGYEQRDMTGSIAEWREMNHPEDLVASSKMLDDYIEGKIDWYECEIRMKHRDGSYIWTKDVGKIAARDEKGTPIRLIGGHLNIDKLKRSEERLTEALETLEHNKQYLETQIANGTKEILEQDKMLWTVNQISRKLLAYNAQQEFSVVVQDCLRLLGESIKRNRVYIWSDYEIEKLGVCCTQIYEWVKGVMPIQGEEKFESIPYKDLPNFADATESGRCLNCLIKDLADTEQAILSPQGIKTILIAPISFNGKRWGFIGVDNCEDEQLFTEVEENMLFMSGSMLANTIEKMKKDERIREIEQRTQIMLDATPLCCNLWTPELLNMGCNEEAVRLFELSSQSEYLERFYELSPEFQPDGCLSQEKAAECIIKAFDEGYCRFEWMHQKLDGTPIPTEVTLVRIKHKDSFIVAGYTRDLRELKAMLAELQIKEDSLRIARDEALQSSKAKSNFLANMSHEIRTPMNAISGLAEIIMRESYEGKCAEYAKGIKSACGNLLNIINDILDISKIESGKLEIFNSQYELASLLNDVITISRVRLGNKPLMFITDIDSKLPARMIGDEIRIKQVLINMLSNAIKFTQSGYIKLRVSGRIIDKKAELQFSVEDSGSGIKPEDLEKLFVEFERVNTTKNRTIEGTGLGLAISKRLCEMMNGTIVVSSTFGEGSEFKVTIPQECPEYEQLAQVKFDKTVLLYETRELYQESIVETIENLGCKCVVCANQSELYEIIDMMQYDFILTASLHLKKVQTLIQKRKLKVTLATFAEYGEVPADEHIYTILFPVNCLQLAELLNGNRTDGVFLKDSGSKINFTAPSAHVLVVDDNSVNLSVAAGLMEPFQFEIDTAVNGLEAVKMVKSKKYDLVFMDHMMPEMDGIDATAAIRKLEGSYYRELPIVALTANALVGTREMFIREGMNDFLAKPIEVNRLSHVIAKWLPKSKIITVVSEISASKACDSVSFQIEGLNTKKGIISVGGSIDNYMNILSVYYTDGSQKSALLLKYVSKKQISAFRTEIHALKSTSATIGAMELSSAAAKLESAAQKEDIEFIDEHIQQFVNLFEKLLKELEPIVVEELNKQMKGTATEKTAGDAAYLKDKLEELEKAAEYADIGTIEGVVTELKEHEWEEQVNGELSVIEQCLAVFDYDGVSESVARLKKNYG